MGNIWIQVKNPFKTLDKHFAKCVCGEKTVHIDKTKIQARAAWTRACTKQREMEQMKQGEFHRELPGTRKIFTSA